MNEEEFRRLHEETHRRQGWNKIASDAHAHQLLRRELKHHWRFQQRSRTKGYAHPEWLYSDLLRIKKGNWYKFMKNKSNGACGILIWEIGK